MIKTIIFLMFSFLNTLWQSKRVKAAGNILFQFFLFHLQHAVKARKRIKSVRRKMKTRAKIFACVMPLSYGTPCAVSMQCCNARPDPL